MNTKDIGKGASPAARACLDAAREQIEAVGGRAFGMLMAAKATETDVVAYASPALVKEYPNGYFDGASVCVPEPLIALCAMEQCAGQGAGVTPLLLVFLIRSILNHETRLGELDDSLAQIAGETSAYCKARIAWPRLTWGPTLDAIYPASVLSRKDMMIFSVLSEKKIAEEIMGNPEHPLRPALASATPSFCRAKGFPRAVVCKDALEEHLPEITPTALRRKRV